MGSIVLTSQVRVSPRAFVRDCLGYIVALLLLAILASKQSIGVHEATMFPVLYGIYVLIVIVGDVLACCCSTQSSLDGRDSDSNVMSAFWHAEEHEPIPLGSSRRGRYTFVTRHQARNADFEFEMSEPMLTSAETTFSGKFVEDYFPEQSTYSKPILESWHAKPKRVVFENSSMVRRKACWAAEVILSASSKMMIL